MPALAPPVPDDRTALAAYLHQQQEAFRTVAQGLTDDQAGLTPTPSTLSVGALVKHATGVQRQWFPRDVGGAWSVRWVWFHLVEELARHAGHADIIREAVDGAAWFAPLAAREGWPETPWVTPWRPPAPSADSAQRVL